MKVTIYCAQSINGTIARTNGRADFISDKSWDNFVAKAKETGNLVTGRKTYDKMNGPEGIPKELEGVKIVVLSRSADSSASNKDILFVKSPREALDTLKDNRFEEVLVGGGGEINGAFIRDKLVDEILVDVEPSIVGTGVNMFGTSGAEAKLELLSTEKFSENELTLRYRVVN